MATVLIVDDQVSVVDAMYNGINWLAIGVNKVLKAYNAFEAKQCFAKEQIDVMLSDIEMPVENGLSLFKWTRENQYDAECIFLTSHADFQYAQEALSLGGFEYILQPAKYEEVEKAIKCAVNKIYEKRDNLIVNKYGELLKKEQGVLVDYFLTQWLKGEQVSKSVLVKTLEKIDVDLCLDERFAFVILDFVKFEKNKWENDTVFRYAITNILQEIVTQYEQKVFLLKVDDTGYVAFLYGGNNDLEKIKFESLLSHFSVLCHQHLRVNVASYACSSTCFETFTDYYKALQLLRNNNAAKCVGIYWEDEKIENAVVDFLDLQFQRIEQISMAQNFSVVELELEKCLGAITDNGYISADALRIYYQHFMQFLFKYLDVNDINFFEILTDKTQQEQFMSAHASLQDSKDMIKIVSKAVEQFNKQDMQESPIDAVVKYINENIEQDIRRTDIAKAMHMSPDYISHLFKKEMNISLSDFIISEKMKLAHSLLLATQLPVSVVAARVGYNNFSHFSKTYKKIYGVTPAKVRKNAEP